MVSYNTIYKKMATAPGQNGAAGLHDAANKLDPARHISSAVAHELNNALTIVQCYSEYLLQKHHDDPELQPDLKLISDAARRATLIIREARPQNALTRAPQPSQNLELAQQSAA